MGVRSEEGVMDRGGLGAIASQFISGKKEAKSFGFRILRQRSTKGSWKKMQKFEITVSKRVIVFLDILSK